MLALSIRQPHIYGMIHLGKRFENRDDSRGVVPNVCRHVGPFLLHASGGMTRRELCDALDAWQDDGRITGAQHTELVRAKLPRGGIVGYARAIGRVDPEGWFHGPDGRYPASLVVDADALDERWWNGRSMSCRSGGGHALVLDDVRELPFIECLGRLGMWRVPADVLRRLARAGHRFDRHGNLLYRSGDRWVTVPV
jgi:hypothetical protein